MRGCKIPGMFKSSALSCAIAGRTMARLVFLLIGLVALFSTELQAGPASPFPFEVKQPDGTKMQMTLHGDEYDHCLEDPDGYTVVQKDKWFHYAVQDESGNLAATDLKAGIDDPKARGLKKHARNSDKIIEAKRAKCNPPWDRRFLKPGDTGAPKTDSATSTNQTSTSGGSTSSPALDQPASAVTNLTNTLDAPKTAPGSSTNRANILAGRKMACLTVLLIGLLALFSTVWRQRGRKMNT